MRNSNDKNNLIAILYERPLISYACKKAGISRATLYRWMKDNPEFRKKVEEALKYGVKNMCEVAEATVFKNILEGDLASSKFYLENKDPTYMRKRSVYVKAPEFLPHPLKHGETCEYCLYQKPKPMTFAQFQTFEMMLRSSRTTERVSKEDVTEKDYEIYLEIHFPGYVRPT